MNRFNSFYEKERRIKSIFQNGNLKELLEMDKIDYRILISNEFLYKLSYTDVSIMEHVITHGTNVNYQGTSSCFITYALQCLNDSMLKLIIERGSKDAFNREIFNLEALYAGEKMIHYVTKYRGTEVISMLIDKGVELESVNKAGLTPIMIACKYRDVSIVQLFLNKMSDKNKLIFYACQNPNVDVIRLLANYDITCEERDKSGNGLIHHACVYKNLPVVQFLVEHGDDPELKNTLHERPIHLVCRNKRNQAEIVEYLISQNVDLECSDDNGMRSIHHACQTSDTNIVSILLNKVDLEAKNSDGQRPIHMACQNIGCGDLIVDLLISKGVDLNVADKFGKTPIFYAIENNSLDRAIVSRLLNKVNLQHLDSFGMSPLHYAKGDVLKMIHQKIKKLRI